MKSARQDRSFAGAVIGREPLVSPVSDKFATILTGAFHPLQHPTVEVLNVSERVVLDEPLGYPLPTKIQ